MFKMMTQRAVLKHLKAFFHEVTVTGFVYKLIIFLSLDVLRSHNTWSSSSRKRMQKPGIACCRINAVMHTPMHLMIFLDFFDKLESCSALVWWQILVCWFWTEKLKYKLMLRNQVCSNITYVRWWKWFYWMNPCLYDQQCSCREY